MATHLHRPCHLAAALTGVRRQDRAAAESIRSLELFEQSSVREIANVRSLMTPMTFPAGRELVTEGDVGRECFIIRRGTAEVTSGGVTRATLGPGTCFGEMALLDGERRRATVTACSELEVYVLSASEFRQLLDDAPAAAERIKHTMCNRLRAA